MTVLTDREAALVRAIRRAMGHITEWGTDNGLVAFRVRDVFELAALLSAEGVTASDDQEQAA